MAGTLFKAISAVGLKATAFLQSFLLFPFYAFLQGMNRFPIFGKTKQPTLPSSTPPGSTSPVSAACCGVSIDNTATGDGNDNNNNIDDNDKSGDMMPALSLAAAGSEPQQQNRKSPTPQIVPVLPLVAPAVNSENCAPTKASSDAELRDGISRLDLNDPKPTPTPLVLNGIPGSVTTTSTAENATNTSTKNGPNTPNGFLPLQDGSSGASSGSTQEVTRSPAVLLTANSVSQTTIELDGETVQIQAKVETPEEAAERARHSRFMREALDMARLALRTNETPVGCVLVYKDRVIAKGMNATNVSRNGTRHAELMALSALLSYSPASDIEPAKANSSARTPLGDKTNEAQPDETSTWGDIDPTDGHLYPYGQKLHPSPRVDPAVITECTLYVTVEPCVMCASLLRQFGIKKVYFGAVNDKFGGTGGVFRIHKNSPHSMASCPASPAPQAGKGLARPAPEPRPASAGPATETAQATMGGGKSEDSLLPLSDPDLPGDGGNVERGYEAEGGWGRDEAVTLLRQFYVQENNRAPVPRKKEGRAARLAAMMERDGHAGGPMADGNGTPTSQENTGANTPEIEKAATEEGAEVAEAAEATAIAA